MPCQAGSIWQDGIQYGWWGATSLIARTLTLILIWHRSDKKCRIDVWSMLVWGSLLPGKFQDHHIIMLARCIKLFIFNQTNFSMIGIIRYQILVTVKKMCAFKYVPIFSVFKHHFARAWSNPVWGSYLSKNVSKIAFKFCIRLASILSMIRLCMKMKSYYVILHMNYLMIFFIDINGIYGGQAYVGGGYQTL